MLHFREKAKKNKGVLWATVHGTSNYKNKTWHFVISLWPHGEKVVANLIMIPLSKKVPFVYKSKWSTHTHAPKWITSKMFGPWNLHTWRTMSHYSIGVCNFVCVCVNVQFMFMQKHRYVCVLNRCQPPISFLRHHPLCLLKPDFSLAWNRVSQAG